MAVLQFCDDAAYPFDEGRAVIGRAEVTPSDGPSCVFAVVFDAELVTHNWVIQSGRASGIKMLFFERDPPVWTRWSTWGMSDDPRETSLILSYRGIAL